MSDNVNGVKVVTWMGIAFVAYTLITVLRGVVQHRCEENEDAQRQDNGDYTLHTDTGPNAVQKKMTDMKGWKPASKLLPCRLGLPTGDF